MIDNRLKRPRKNAQKIVSERFLAIIIINYRLISNE